MAASLSRIWIRKTVDLSNLPRIKLNNLQDLPGAKKKVSNCVCVRRDPLISPAVPYFPTKMISYFMPGISDTDGSVVWVDHDGSQDLSTSVSAPLPW